MLDAKPVKCVVWDLDNTLWSGVLLEGDAVTLREGVVEAIRTLDERGILHSIASRGDHDRAMQQLEEFQLREYFLCPQINWGAKSASVASIAKCLDIGTDTLAFIDDDPFERDEVSAGVPGVRSLDAAMAGSLPELPAMQPPVITEDSRHRRTMYQAEFKREEAAAGMAPEQFLRSLEMIFTISEAEEGDLARVEELTVRTNQLNSTGATYSADELEHLRRSPDHLLLIAGLHDRYGTYGKIGMAVIELSPEAWVIRLLLMSCRVISRGVGKVLLSYILQRAAAEGKTVVADFIRTPRNRAMYMTFKLAGFREVNRVDEVARLVHDLTVIDPYPEHVEVRIGRRGVPASPGK